MSGSPTPDQPATTTPDGARTSAPVAATASATAPPAATAARPANAQPLAIDVRGIRRSTRPSRSTWSRSTASTSQVEPGEFFGLLGPNGAGKTTLIKILTTLLLPSEGTAQIFGFDVERQTKQIRRIMNMVAGGEQSGYGILTVREQLWMFSQFYGLPSRDGWHRVDELIDAVGLDEQREQRVSTLSTGQRQKMNFARGLLNDPWIFFLDEPTLGLDVAAARAVRELVLAWKAAVPGRTVLLTTHYMAEADELCDRIAIVDHGRILALGTPAELKKRVQRESVFRLELDRLDGGLAALAALPGVVSRRAAARPTRPTARAIARRSRSTWPSPMTPRSAASSGRSAGSARRSSRSASPSPPSRTCSSSSSGAASATRRPMTTARRRRPPAPTTERHGRGRAADEPDVTDRPTTPGSARPRPSDEHARRRPADDGRSVATPSSIARPPARRRRQTGPGARSR